MGLFPYSEPRDGQEEIMEKVEEGVRLGTHVLINGSTGIGKTVAILTPLMDAYLSKGLRILYLTRTHTQQEQALLEFSRICKKGEIEAYAVGVQGKMSLCPLLYLDSRLSEESISHDEFREICETLRNNSLKEEYRPFLEEEVRFVEGIRGFSNVRIKLHKFSTCPFFYLSSERLESALDVAYSICKKHHVVSADDLQKISFSYKICPHLLMKELLPEAAMIIAPYNYVFQPDLRALFLSSYLGIAELDELKGFSLVVDEAHNIPNFLLEVQKKTLSYYTIRAASSELQRYWEVIGQDPAIKRALGVLEGIYNELLESLKNIDEEGFKLELKEFYERLRLEFGQDPYLISQSLLDAGERVIKEKKEEFSRKMRRRLRSYLKSVGKFLSYLSEAYSSKSCYLFVNPGPSLVVCDFDTAKSGEIVDYFWCSIHSSGTLIPFEAYSSEVGISHYLKVDVGKSFLRERRKIFYHPYLTTRYQEMEEDKEMQEKIRKFLIKLLSEVRCKSLIFFPSYEVMNRIVTPETLGILEEVYNLVLQEDKRLKTHEVRSLIRSFRNSRSPSLFIGVIGGRVSEGVDFPQRSVEMIVIVGLPYPKPDPIQEARYDYYKKLLGSERRAWLRAYEVPMIRRLCQAMGRLIRGEQDYGVIYVIDKRMSRISRKIRERAVPCSDPKKVRDAIIELRKKFSIIEKRLS